MKINECKVINVPTHTDERGKLSFIQTSGDMPFDIKRVFYLYNVPEDRVRGEHAHKKCHQLLVALHGSCTVIVDDGDNKNEYVLGDPELGLYIPPMIWTKVYDFKNDAVVAAFTSDIYDAGDYIREYDDYTKIISG